jgi:hypothetical protein
MKFKTSASILTAPGKYIHVFTIESEEYINHVDRKEFLIRVLEEKPNNIPPYFTGTYIYN